MNGITDLFKSERGIVSLALLVGATVLTAIGKLTADQWQHFAVLVLGIYVAGKTVTGAAAIWKSSSTSSDGAIGKVADAAQAYIGHMIAQAQQPPAHTHAVPVTQADIDAAMAAAQATPPAPTP